MYANTNVTAAKAQLSSACPSCGPGENPVFRKMEPAVSALLSSTRTSTSTRTIGVRLPPHPGLVICGSFK